MYFDRFDICEAYYCYAMDYHGGQSIKLYKILGRLYRMQFKPVPGLRYDMLQENGKEIYDNLFDTNYED